MKKLGILTLLFLILNTSFSINISAQTNLNSKTDSLIKKIAEYNIVEGEFIGRFMDPSKQYYRYKKLLALNDTSLFLKLLHHQNPTVRYYAFHALVDKTYKEIDKAFAIILENDAEIQCRTYNSFLSTEAYAKYELSSKYLEQNAPLKVMDSLIIINKGVDIFLRAEALKNRVYTGKLNQEIKKLAFEDLDFFAIQYLYRWERAMHQKALIEAIGSWLNSFPNECEEKYSFEMINMALRMQSKSLRIIAFEIMLYNKSWLKEDYFDFILNEEYTFFDVEDIEYQLTLLKEN